jgi:hypothetical protein
MSEHHILFLIYAHISLAQSAFFSFRGLVWTKKDVLDVYSDQYPSVLLLPEQFHGLSWFIVADGSDVVKVNDDWWSSEDVIGLSRQWQESCKTRVLMAGVNFWSQTGNKVHAVVQLAYTMVPACVGRCNFATDAIHLEVEDVAFASVGYEQIPSCWQTPLRFSN